MVSRKGSFPGDRQHTTTHTVLDQCAAADPNYHRLGGGGVILGILLPPKSGNIGNGVIRGE